MTTSPGPPASSSPLWSGLQIAKRPSGGRGEYEFMGSSQGVSATDLFNHGIVLDTPYGRKETQVYADKQGGKNRARLLNSRDRRNPHIAPLVAALLLMPAPIRDETAVSSALPILLDRRYILDVGVDLVHIKPGEVTLRPRLLTARSGDISDANTRLTINVDERHSSLALLYDFVAELPDSLAGAVARHRDAVQLPGMEFYPAARRAIEDIMRSLLAADPYYLPDSDPLPALLHLAGLSSGIENRVPLPPETPADSIEIRLRADRYYRQKLVAAGRGAAARKFSKEVNSAYGYACLFCGFHGPHTTHVRSGVEAAHILPWAQYDLDVVPNGISLCRQHHWAFDERVLSLDSAGGSYFVNRGVFFEEVSTVSNVNRAIFLDVLGRLPDERLPPHPERPSARFLEEFNALIQ